VKQYVAGGSFQPFNKGAGAKCYPAGATWQPALVQLASNYHPYIPGTGTVHIADLQFHVTGAVPGNSIVQSLFNPVADGWADSNFVFSLNAVFGSAWIIPEPTTAMLVGVGFLGLVAAARRRRHA
jgi:hypothetical protein